MPGGSCLDIHINEIDDNSTFIFQQGGVSLMAKIEKTALKRYTGGNPCCGQVGEWITIYLETDSDITRVGDDILVSNPMGMYKMGDVIPSTENVFNVLQNALTQYIPPIYTPPTVSISIIDGPEPGAYPPGTKFTTSIVSKCEQNDGGILISHKVFLNDQEIASSETDMTIETTAEWTLNDTVTLTAVYEYGEGPVKVDSLGNLVPEGHIIAGTATAEASTGGAEYTVQYTTYIGCDSTEDLTAIPTESEIKALQNTQYDVVKGDHFELPFNAGTNRYIIAVPAEVGEIDEIIYKEAGYQDILNLFTVDEIDLHVSDIDPELTHTYKVYHATWQQPMAVDLTMLITI